MGKNKALAHHTSTYFYTRRVCVDLTQLLSQPTSYQVYHRVQPTRATVDISLFV